MLITPWDAPPVSVTDKLRSYSNALRKIALEVNHGRTKV